MYKQIFSHEKHQQRQRRKKQRRREVGRLGAVASVPGLRVVLRGLQATGGAGDDVTVNIMALSKQPGDA